MKREFRPAPQVLLGPSMSVVNYLRMQIRNSMMIDFDEGEKARELERELLDYLECFKGHPDADRMIRQIKGIAELEVK